MVNNIMIKNDSFIQSMHNDIQCLSLDTAIRPCDRCWFTSKQIQDWAGMDRVTLNRKLEKLINVGRVINNSETIDNTSESMRFKFEPHQTFTDIMSITLYGANNIPHETKIYNLNVLNHLAMIELDNEKLNAIANKFSDILSEVETTGQYNAIQLDRKTQLQLAIINSKPNSVEQLSAIAALEELHAEEKKALAAENETLTQQNDTLHTELDLIRSTMFTNRRVCEMIRERFDIKYADSTLRGKVGKTLKLISNELSENIIYRKDFVDGVLRSTPYYTERTMNKLIQRLEDNPAYLKSIK